MTPKKIMIIIFILIFLFISINLIRFIYHFRISRQLVAKSQVFTQEGTRAAALFIGDSTGVGTGAQKPEESVAGYFGADHKDLSIDNLSKNGAKVEDILPKIKELPKDKYKLIVIQIGGNNIIQFTNVEKFQKDLDESVKTAKEKSDNVLLITTGNVGLAPFFPWPLNAIYSKKSRDVREMAIKITKKYGAYYVDLYKNKKEDPFAADPNKYHAIDGLHPSSDGYEIWYQKLNQTIIDNSLKI